MCLIGVDALTVTGLFLWYMEINLKYIIAHLKYSIAAHFIMWLINTYFTLDPFDHYNELCDFVNWSKFERLGFLIYLFIIHLFAHIKSIIHLYGRG